VYWSDAPQTSTDPAQSLPDSWSLYWLNRLRPWLLPHAVRGNSLNCLVLRILNHYPSGMPHLQLRRRTSNMNTKRSLLVLGLFATAGVVTVSCGGSDSSNGDGKAGSSSASAGTTSKAGTTGSSAGTSSSSTGGTASNTGGASNTAGRTNNGGRNTGGTQGLPNLGGAFEIAACEAGTMTGATCTPVQGAQNACQLNDTTYCGCGSGDNPTWTCISTDDFTGAGGAGSFEATCPDNAMTGDACTGIGLCTGPNACACYQDKVYCQ
jgi:hypothetical protein